MNSLQTGCPSARAGVGITMPWNDLIARFAKMVLAPEAATNIAMFARGLLAPAPYPQPILEVGFGRTSPLAGLHRVGVNIDFAGARRHRPVGVVGDAAALPFPDGSFPAMFSFGLLHKLADGAARQLITELMRVGRFDGCVVVFDGVQPNPASPRPLASLIGKLDGPHMRNERELRTLFDGHPTWHFQRVTYAATGLEGMWCVSRGQT